MAGPAGWLRAANQGDPRAGRRGGRRGGGSRMVLLRRHRDLAAQGGHRQGPAHGPGPQRGGRARPPRATVRGPGSARARAARQGRRRVRGDPGPERADGGLRGVWGPGGPLARPAEDPPECGQRRAGRRRSPAAGPPGALARGRVLEGPDRRGGPPGCGRQQHDGAAGGSAATYRRGSRRDRAVRGPPGMCAGLAADGLAGPSAGGRHPPAGQGGFLGASEHAQARRDRHARPGL